MTTDKSSSSHTAFDVVVVGAGMAGHCAALAGAQAGARVLWLEKQSEPGGSTAMCGGALAFAGTDIQRAKGIEDSPELLEEDLMKAGKYRNDRALVHEYAVRQYDAYRWLTGLGVRIESVSLSGSQSVPRNHATHPQEALACLRAHALNSGKVTLRTSAAVRRLWVEAEAGVREVKGVVLESGERIASLGGVILATGGFSRAADLVERFAPELSAARPMGGEGNTGDGLRMAWALGADMADMGHAKGTFGAPVETPRPGYEGRAPRIVSAMYRGAIIVNRLGRRFVDESVSYKVIGDVCLRQPGVVGFQIFDQRVMDQSAPLPSVADYQGALAAGLIKQADSLQALAQMLGVDWAGLDHTVQQYNAACRGLQADEWGRQSLSTGFGKPTPVEKAPFYGIACTTGLTSTFCGIRTDVHARALDVYGEPIFGLYAVGEVTGGFHGEAYMSGSSLGKGCVFGRIAADHAAARAGVAR
ncbi:MAG: FAD-dependent oxidoreductase [Betaproteobacteria bacterium]|nr:FAD-dependent oxidoreductase [Betaproteobacteria bacterium]